MVAGLLSQAPRLERVNFDLVNWAKTPAGGSKTPGPARPPSFLKRARLRTLHICWQVLLELNRCCEELFTHKQYTEY